MFRLRIGYLLAGIVTGLVLLFSFFWSLPDGKLHIVFCDVGQGDASYIRFPDGRDMVVDGGPNDKIISCLSNHMPFWDRHINIVAMTHPQKDHAEGLISVFERYNVDYFVRSDVDNTTEGYQTLTNVVNKKHIPVKYVTTGVHIDVGVSSLSVIWPSSEQIAKGKTPSRSDLAKQGPTSRSVLGASIVGELNDYSLVFWLRYGSFDALFTGDADNHVEAQYTGLSLARLDSASSSRLADDSMEVLKVPHHGSKTGMTKDFVDWLKPKLAVISVGKNTYGHPTPEALQLLADVGSRVLRTDKDGDIEIISDGANWIVRTGK